MKTSTEIESVACLLGEERAIEAIAKAGFDAWDFSMCSMFTYDWKNMCLCQSDHPIRDENYLAYARKLKQIGLDNGIRCNQSHAPFPVKLPEIQSYLKRVIECTAEAGGEICVIHPNNDKTPEENAEMYLELLPFAKGCGVKLATENMWNWDTEKDHSLFAACATPESFCAHVDAVGDEYLVACLDVGHAEMLGSDTTAVDMIHGLGSKRLKALHIHDNDKRYDMHQIPFSRCIDFIPVVKELKKIGYDGYFTLECNSYLRQYTEENAFDGVCELAAVVRRLANMFDEFN